MHRPFTLVLAVGLLGSSAGFALADAKVDEKIVAPAAGSGAAYILSPRGARVAAVANKGSRIVVIVDGVESQPYDQMLSPDGRPSGVANTIVTGDGAPVVFSRDGAHYAYAARLGNDVLVMHDGKEVARIPFSASALSFGPLAFSPGGKHLYFTRWDPAKSTMHFVMDGAEVPILPAGDAIQFSADDGRYLYDGVNPAKPDAQVLAIDGKDAGYLGAEPLFTADNKSVVCIGQSGNAPTLLIDGKPSGPTGVQRFYLPRAGNKVVSIVTRPNPGGQRYSLVVDGNKIEGSDCINGIDRVAFSPDGNRYAARCKGQTNAWMIVDGKKELDYAGIDDEFRFSPDSSKFAYVAGNGAKSFVVVNGQESDGFSHILVKPAFSPTGSRLAFVYGENRLDCHVWVDGKSYAPARDVGGVQFSADGSRFLYNFGVDLNTGGLAVDGEEQKGFLGSRTMFSPDGKHLFFVGQQPGVTPNGIFVDKQMIWAQQGRVTRQAFSPDGQHVYWGTVELQPNRTGVIYADGKPVAKFDADANAALEGMPEAFEVNADGTASAIVIAADGVKRLTITPDAASNVTAMVTGAQSAQANAAAAAEAAKAKSAADAAQAKADADAARAKAQADAMAAREKATADRAKAQQEAAAKRLKAQQDAAAARAEAAADKAAKRSGGTL